MTEILAGGRAFEAHLTETEVPSSMASYSKRLGSDLAQITRHPDE